MAILNIQPARRTGAKIILGLAGPSGGGKTYTALLIAYGLAKRNAAKVGLLDAENKRGSLYAYILPNKAAFQIGDLAPPFSPSRYATAIREFEQAGVEVLVIDSITHEWEGTGGCEEIATEGNPKTPRWNKAKLEHKKMMNAALNSSMHIIFCVRAREKVKMETVDGKAVFTPLGFQPVQEKNFMFEMTGSLMLHDQGRRQEILKCPADLLPILGQGKGFLGIEHGEKLRAWIDGGEAIDPKLAKVKAELATACEQGTEAFKTAWTAAWKSLDATQRELIHADLETYKASAAGYDEHKRKLSEDETAVDQVAAKLAVNGGTNAGNSTATSHERID